MALEVADIIAELVATNPPGTDAVSQGDDHLRLIKHCLQSVVTQAIAEDDTDQTPQIWSSERIAQAIAAFSGAGGASFKATGAPAGEPSGKTQAAIATELWDTGGDYDAAASAFKPLENGIYQLGFTAEMQLSGEAYPENYLKSYLYKNGSLSEAGQSATSPEAIDISQDSGLVVVNTTWLVNATNAPNDAWTFWILADVDDASISMKYTAWGHSA